MTAPRIQPGAPIAPANHAPAHLSPSQVDCYLECPARWYYKYRLREPDPPSIALAVGRALHSIAAWLWRGIAAARQAGRTPPDADELSEYCAANWPDIVRDELAQVTATATPATAAAAAQGAQLLAAALPHIRQVEPQLVEHPLSGQIGGIPVRGIADVITVSGQVLDLKTAARKYGEIPQNYRLQLTTYGMLAHTVQTKLLTLVKTKAPYAIEHTHVLTPADTLYAATIYPMVAESIADHRFLPRRSSNLCTRTNCPFWRQCEGDHGGKVRGEEEE